MSNPRDLVTLANSLNLSNIFWYDRITHNELHTHLSGLVYCAIIRKTIVAYLLLTGLWYRVLYHLVGQPPSGPYRYSTAVTCWWTMEMAWFNAMHDIICTRPTTTNTYQILRYNLNCIHFGSNRSRISGSADIDRSLFLRYDRTAAAGTQQDPGSRDPGIHWDRWWSAGPQIIPFFYSGLIIWCIFRWQVLANWSLLPVDSSDRTALHCKVICSHCRSKMLWQVCWNSCAY